MMGAQAARAEGIRLGPLRDVLHVVVDLQRLFADATPWQVPDLPSILPQCRALLAHRPDAVAFSRFRTPPDAAAAQGAWQGYYRHWQGVTSNRMAAAMFDVVADLAEAAPGAPMIDKVGYSVFSCPDMAPLLLARQSGTLLFTGVETDVCVLSSVLGAVDRGFRVVIARDAVTSASQAGHDAALTILGDRFEDQVELATTAEIIAAWHT